MLPEANKETAIVISEISKERAIHGPPSTSICPLLPNLQSNNLQLLREPKVFL